MAADQLGYYGVLLPTGRSCEESWVTASANAPYIRQLRFLVALRPGLVSPTMGARLAATLDRVTDGRLLINVVTGGDPVELKADGLWLKHDERYELTAESLRVWRQVMQGGFTDFEGRLRILSGGQKQRVARALPAQPRLILLDEPLGALDALTRLDMQRLIERLWLEAGFTAVLVTHDVTETVLMADRILVIDEGRLTLDQAVHLSRPRTQGPDFDGVEAMVLQSILSCAATNARAPHVNHTR